jgi:Peptidase A4 family
VRVETTRAARGFPFWFSSGLFPVQPSGSLCQRSSAEVISEAPSSGTAILPLTNFRAESFTDVVVTNSHGQRAGLRAPWWDTFGVSTENTSGAVLDQPTQIFRARASGCYWMAQS